ncbi:MAG: helix-turn-helix domain-containing protein [Paracoccaceae bacterium]
MLKSPAWRSLSGAAVKVLLELHTRFNGGNNGNVRLSLAEAAKSLGPGKATVQRALTDLQDRGFIILTVLGNWYHRRAHEWQLTTKPMQTPRGKIPATNDWRKWSQKTKDGPPQNHKTPCLAPSKNQKTESRSKSEPVSPVCGPAIGSEMEH